MAKEEDIEKWLNKKHDPKSKKDFEAFEKIMEAGSKFTAPSTKSKDDAWQELVTKIEEEKNDSKTYRLWPVFTAAAAVIAILIVGYVYVFASTEISAQKGELRTYSLPDGTEVMLNAGSTLSYKSYNWSENRIVRLSGEAFFNVVEGSPFTVENDFLEITVLGTSFNAHLRAEKQSVHCFSGKIRVVSADTEAVLRKGEAFIKQNKVTFSKATSADWRKGNFNYVKEPLNLVVDELERQFNIEIKSSADLSTRVYTGSFTNNQLEAALELVFKPMGLNYKVDGREVRIQ